MKDEYYHVYEQYKKLVKKCSELDDDSFDTIRFELLDVLSAIYKLKDEVMKEEWTWIMNNPLRL